MQICCKKLFARFQTIQSRLTAMLLLWILAITFFAPAHSPARGKAPGGMVYCPLSKKFQPVNPPEEKLKQKPFKNLCASTETKALLIQEIFVKNLFNKIPTDQHALDTLAFNFLEQGKAVLEERPGLPDSPSENSVRQFHSGMVVNNNQEYKFVWKQIAKTLSLAIAARPPTSEETFLFTFNSIYKSAQLSRCISPRAPPFFS